MRKKGKYKKLYAGLILLCMLVLAACGKEEEPEPEYGYLPAFASVPVKVTNNNLCDIAEEGIYIVTFGANGTVSWYDTERGEKQKLFSLPENVSAERLFVGGNTQERLLLCVSAIYECDEKGVAKDISYSLQCYTMQGELLWENMLDGFSKDNTFNPFGVKCFMAEDGHTFMAVSSDLYVISPEGECISKQEYPIENLESSVSSSVFASDGDGAVYLVALAKPALGGLDDLGQYKIYQWNGETFSMEETDTVEGKMPLQTAVGDGLLFHDMYTAYRYRGTSEEMESAFSLEENLISYYQIDKVLEEENGWRMLLHTDSGLQIVSLEWGLKEAETFLSVASSNVNDTLKEGIRFFNQRHPEYLLQIRDYGTNDVQGRLQQIQLSMSGKNPPDLIEMWSMQEYVNYAQKGWLEDLSPYLEKSERLSLEDFVPALREALTVNGGFYALPQEFDLTTLAIPKSVAEGRSSWNIEEFLDFMEEYPNAYFYYRNGEQDQNGLKKDILHLALRRGLAGFIDAEQGKVDFDNERFRSLMTRINEMQFDESAGWRDADLERRVGDGEILMPAVSIDRVDRLYQLENTYCQEMVLIGYPGTEREDGGASMTIDRPTGISGNSRNKEGAWCYLEESVVEETGATGGFPARQKELAEMLAEACDGAEDAEELNMWKRYTDMVTEAIGTASVDDPAMRQLRIIISEEATFYFSGVKSLDEVIEVMESRAEMYFNENN